MHDAPRTLLASAALLLGCAGIGACDLATGEQTPGAAPALPFPSADAGSTPHDAFAPDNPLSPVYYGSLDLAMQGCTGCHASGGLAGPALDSYVALRTNVDPAISAILSGHTGDPVDPAPGCAVRGAWERAGDDLVEALTAWRDAGFPAGAPASASPRDPLVARLGAPDRTLATATFAPDDGPRCFDLGVLASGAAFRAARIAPARPTVASSAALYAVDAATTVEDGERCDAPLGRLVAPWRPGAGEVELFEHRAIRVAAGERLVVRAASPDASAPTHVTVELWDAPAPEGAATFLPIHEGFWVRDADGSWEIVGFVADEEVARIDFREDRRIPACMVRRSILNDGELIHFANPSLRSMFENDAVIVQCVEGATGCWAQLLVQLGDDDPCAADPGSCLIVTPE